MTKRGPLVLVAFANEIRVNLFEEGALCELQRRALAQARADFAEEVLAY